MKTANLAQWIRRGAMVSTIYVIGALEAYYMPRYGIEWMLGALAATVFVAACWIRLRWD